MELLGPRVEAAPPKDTAAWRLAEALGRSGPRAVEALKLTLCPGVSNTAARTLAEAIGFSTRLRALELEPGPGGQADEKLMALASAVRSNWRLSSLKAKLHSVSSSDPGRALVEAIGSNVAIREVDLEICSKAGDETLTSLAKILKASLSLQSVKLLLCFPVSDNAAVGLSDSLASNESVRHLKIAFDYGISDEGLTSLSKGVAANASLRSLEVSIDLPSADALVHAMSYAISRNSRLQTLKLRCRGSCEDDTCEVFAAALFCNTTLRELSVSGASSLELIQPCLTACRVTQTLTSLDVDCRQDWENSAFGIRETLTTISDLLDMNCNLQHLRLDLPHTYDADHVVAGLAASLAGNARLLSWHVSGGRLGSRSLAALQKSMRTNVVLCEASLAVNVGFMSPVQRVDAAMLAAIDSALRRNAELARCWQHICWLSLEGSCKERSAAVDAMTTRGFRRTIFTFLVPKESPGSWRAGPQL